MANIYDMVDVWNASGTTFTSIKMNVTDTASASGSLLMDLQVGGTTEFSVAKDGSFGGLGTNIRAQSSYLDVVYAGTVRGIMGVDDGAAMFKLQDSGFFGWSPNATASSTADVRLWRDSAGTLAQRNGSNAQTFNIYNTYTDASNYERARFGWNSNVFEIAPQAAGTGTTRVLHISGLPTANPGPGILWNNAGTVEVGT